MDDATLAAIGAAPPEDAPDVAPSMKEIQRRAAVAAGVDPALAAIGPAPPEPKSPLHTNYDKVPTLTTPGRIGRDLGLGTRDAVEGIAGLPAMVLDAAGWPGRALIHLGGGTVTAPSTALEEGLDAVGLPKPQTEGEKARSVIARGGASMIGPMAVGAVPRAAAALPALLRPFVASAPTSAPLATAQVAAGGVGAGTGDYLASSDNTPAWAKPTVSVLGGVAGAGLVNAATGLVGSIRNAAQGLTTPIADALARLRIVPRTVGAVTDNPGLQAVEGNISRLPSAAPVLTPAQRDTVGQFHDAVESTARQLGPESTRQEAGGSVQRILQDWHANQFPAEQDAVWNPLHAQMTGEPVRTDAYRTALADMAGDPALAAMPQTQQSFGSARARAWLQALDRDTQGGPITWEEAHAIRRQIGDAMGTPEIIDSLGTQRLRRLYGSLAGGMQDAADNNGLGLQFRQANQATIDAHNFIDNTLVKAIKARNPAQEGVAPDAAATALLNSNSAMQDLRERVPQAADALAAYQLRHAALARPGQQGATDTTSTGTFLTNMRKAQIERPEGTAALYSDPAVGQNLDDLLSVAGHLRETERHVNTSNSGSTMQLASLPIQITAALEHGGVKEALALLGANFAVPYGAAKYLTDPMAIRMAATPAGPRPPLNAKVAGLLGYLAQ
jgi:hypothetical protein